MPSVERDQAFGRLIFTKKGFLLINGRCTMLRRFKSPAPQYRSLPARAVSRATGRSLAGLTRARRVLPGTTWL